MVKKITRLHIFAFIAIVNREKRLSKPMRSWCGVRADWVDLIKPDDGWWEILDREGESTMVRLADI